jgi:hypothetical protein
MGSDFSLGRVLTTQIAMRLPLVEFALPAMF